MATVKHVAVEAHLGERFKIESTIGSHTLIVDQPKTGGGEDAGWDLGPRRALVEEGSQPLLGDVLYVDDGNALSVRFFDSPLDVLKHGIRVPQGEFTAWEVVVLEINHQ